MSAAIVTQGLTAGTKVCSKCGNEKSLDEFYRWNSPRSPDGLQYRCKECAKSHARQWRLDNQEQSNKNSLDWYKANRERAYAARKAWLAKNPGRKKSYDLKCAYGITIQQFDEMLVEQGGGCAICGATDPGGRGSFHVDHDHETAKVRGLLCHGCNTRLVDDPDLLLAMIAYLERTS